MQVGAATEAELDDRKLRIEDAKNATFAAVEEGIVPGGGAALLHLSELVPAFRETLPTDEEKMGADIVMKALRAPCRIIAHNAGVEGEVRGCVEGNVDSRDRLSLANDRRMLFPTLIAVSLMYAGHRPKTVGAGV